MGAVALQKAMSDARCIVVQMMENGVGVPHANLALRQGEVMLNDEGTAYGDAMRASLSVGGAGLAPTLHLCDPGAVDAASACAVPAAATLIIPPADMLRGAHAARVRDPLGHLWAFNAALDPH